MEYSIVYIIILYQHNPLEYNIFKLNCLYKNNYITVAGRTAAGMIRLNHSR